MKQRFISVLVLVAIALTGCSAAQPIDSQFSTPVPDLAVQGDNQMSPTLTMPFGNNTPPTPDNNIPPVDKFVTLSKRDLASRLGIESDKISFIKTAEMLWPNAALGCPRPGVFYPSGRVPGFQIWLKAEGEEYIYNTDFNGTVILCPELNPHVPNSNIGPTPGVPIR